MMSGDVDPELARLARAVARLPRLQRAVFLAKARDGHSYADIAARTGLSRAEVVQQMTLALLNIRRRLGRYRLPWWER